MTRSGEWSGSTGATVTCTSGSPSVQGCSEKTAITDPASGPGAAALHPDNLPGPLGKDAGVQAADRAGAGGAALRRLGSHGPAAREEAGTPPWSRQDCPSSSVTVTRSATSITSTATSREQVADGRDIPGERPARSSVSSLPQEVIPGRHGQQHRLPLSWQQRCPWGAANHHTRQPGGTAW